MNMKLVAVAILCGCWSVSDMRAEVPIINVGSHNLLPDTAGQTVRISVSGAVNVQGLNFNVQVADGYPDGDPAGTVDGPNITGVNIIGTALDPTVFFGNANTPTYVRQNAQMWSLFTTTQSGTVSTDGLLAIVTLDTTGWFSGTWDFALGATQDGPSDFAGIAASITDGSITVVPEPQEYALAVGACLLGFGLARRHWKLRTTQSG